MKEGRREKRAALVASLANTEPSDMSLYNVSAYLGHHGVSQAGPRVLLNWRIQQLRQGLPVVRPIKAPVLWDQVKHTEVARGSPPLQPLILRIPPDVMAQHVFPTLDDESLLAFLFVSRVFYTHCWRTLMARAQRAFGGTPVALSCYYYYARLIRERGVPIGGGAEAPSKKARTGVARERTHKHSVARALHLPQTRFKATYLSLEDLPSYIRLSIQVNGSIDVLKQLPAYRVQQGLAEEMQKRFIIECKPQRLAEVNALLVQQGLGALGGFPLSQTADCAVRLVCGPVWRQNMQSKVDGYVDMRHSTNAPPVIIDVRLHSRIVQALCIAMKTLATHALRPASPFDALIPALIHDKSTPIEQLFSADFLAAQWPTRGTLMCLVGSDAARIIQISEMQMFDRDHLARLLASLGVIAVSPLITAFMPHQVHVICARDT